jgi:hypothetical protein
MSQQKKTVFANFLAFPNKRHGDTRGGGYVGTLYMART